MSNDKTNVTLSYEQFNKLLEAASGSHSVNTTASTRLSNISTKAVKLPQASELAKEPKVPFTVARPYGSYTGGVIKVGVNGISVELYADGVERMVPRSIAIAAKQRLFNLDEMYSEAGPSLGNAETSEWARKGGLASGDTLGEARMVKVETSSYKG